ncbi:MAG: SMP-30/gluconolactonase/LRE family protein [Pseudomonadales bacterium]
MSAKEAKLLYECRTEIGEGPVYDVNTDTLFWVDIPNGHLWRYDFKSDSADYRSIGEPLGSFALIEGGGFLLAAKQGFLVLSHWDATPVVWKKIETDRPTQFNDGKCDSRGRFFAGTTSLNQECTGSLYRIDHEGRVEALISDICMSNGLDWTPDNRYFYYVDTLAYTVFRYEWDNSSGTPRNGAPFISLSSDDGLPDGLTVDADGFLWLAIWGGSKIKRYAPDGVLADIVSLPVKNITSCTFAGPGLSRLCITSALDMNDSGNTREFREGGNLYIVETTTCGQECRYFPRSAIPENIIE